MGSSSSIRSKRKAKTVSKTYENWQDEETPFVKRTLDFQRERQDEKSGEALSDEHATKAMNSEDRSIVCLNIPIRSAWIAVGIFSILLVAISVTLAVLITGS